MGNCAVPWTESARPDPGSRVGVRSVHVVTSDQRRGAETFAVGLVAALRRAGHTAEVVALTASGSPSAHRLEALGRSRRTPGTLWALRCRARTADVVVAHGSSTLEACALALAGTRIPFVYRSIGDPSYWAAHGPRRLAMAMLQRRPRRHVVLWEGARRALTSLHHVSSARIDVIPNAVPEETFAVADAEERRRSRCELGLAADEPCIAYAGALSPEKGLDTLLAALAHLEVTALVAGDGPLRPRLAGADGLTGTGRLRYLGELSDPGPLYAAADLVVLPSATEGMPGTLIEAGLRGTPTVASAVGAIPEMLDDGVNGFLVPSGDALALARAIERALPIAHVVGERSAADFRDRYTMERVLPRWMDTMARAVAS